MPASPASATGSVRPSGPTPPQLAPRLAAALIFALAVVLRLVWFQVPERSPDEELYAHFGAGIAHEGLAWEARIVHDFNRGADVDFPWMWRIGYTGLVGAAMHVTGDYSVRVVEALSVGAGVIAIALTGVLAWSAIGAWPAVAAMLFLALSPLDLALARRGWQDDVVMLIVLGMVMLLLRAASGRHRLARAGFFVLTAYGMTVKESIAIPGALGTVGLALLDWQRTRRWRDALATLVYGALAALASLAAIVAVSGGWSELRQTMILAKEANAPDEYLRHYQMGGVLDYYGRGLIKLQPLPWLLAFGYGALLLVKPRVPVTLRVLAIHLAVFCAVAFSYVSKNMRFLSPVYPAVAILAAAALAAALHAASSAWPRARAALATAAVLVVVGSAARDLHCFHHYFVEDEVQDLATPWFTQVDAQDRIERAREAREER